MRVAFAFGISVTLLAAPSAAQSTSSTAEALFREAKRLMAEKQYAEACPKLAESQRLDPGGGTLLTLALCHEAEGKIATAWSEFHDALAVATADRHADREKVARARIAALTPRLSKLTIVVPESLKTRGNVEILQDGVQLRPAAWGLPTPVDPGTHRVEARAPGKRVWSNEVAIAGDAQSARVEIPELEDEVASVAPPPAPAPAAPTPVPKRNPPPKREPAAQDVRPSSDGWQAVGYVSAGVGLAGLAVGTFFGIRALNQSRDANDKCPDSDCNDSDAVDLSEKAGTSADIATVGFAVGVVGLAVAGYAFWLRPSPTRTSLRVDATFSW